MFLAPPAVAIIRFVVITRRKAQVSGRQVTVSSEQ